MTQRHINSGLVIILSAILLFIIGKLATSVNQYRAKSQSPAEKFLKSKETQNTLRSLNSAMDEMEADQFDYFLILNTDYNKRKANEYLKCQTYYKQDHKGVPLISQQELRIHFLKNDRRDDQIDPLVAMSPEVSPLASYYLEQPDGDLFLEHYGLDLEKLTATKPSFLKKNRLIDFKDQTYRTPVYPAAFSDKIGYKEEGLEKLGYQKFCGHFDPLKRNQDGRLFDHK